MIRVTRLNDSVFFINEDLIEFMEETPDTVITLNTDKKLVVKESIDDLIQQITNFRRSIYLGDISHIVKGDK
ncbi:MAG: flagellar FlbD family protein [Clostridiales bacterium]|nr:flagellar FlbD family protein [Clostridiales bacterium]